MRSSTAKMLKSEYPTTKQHTNQISEEQLLDCLEDEKLPGEAEEKDLTLSSALQKQLVLESYANGKSPLTVVISFPENFNVTYLCVQFLLTQMEKKQDFSALFNVVTIGSSSDIHYTVSMLAARNKNYFILKNILDALEKYPRKKAAFCNHAARRGKLQGTTPLMYAVTQGFLTNARILLEHGAVPDVTVGESFSHYPKKTSQNLIINWMALDFAISNWNKDDDHCDNYVCIMLLLVKNDMDILQQRIKKLHGYIKEDVQTLLINQAYIRAKNASTALTVSIENDDTSTSSSPSTPYSTGSEGSPTITPTSAKR